MGLDFCTEHHWSLEFIITIWKDDNTVRAVLIDRKLISFRIAFPSH